MSETTALVSYAPHDETPSRGAPDLPAFSTDDMAMLYSSQLAAAMLKHFRGRLGGVLGARRVWPMLSVTNESGVELPGPMRGRIHFPGRSLLAPGTGPLRIDLVRESRLASASERENERGQQ